MSDQNTPLEQSKKVQVSSTNRDTELYKNGFTPSIFHQETKQDNGAKKRMTFFVGWWEIGKLINWWLYFFK